MTYLNPLRWIAFVLGAAIYTIIMLRGLYLEHTQPLETQT